MSDFESYGGLTSQTGSVGGGGDGNRHDDDRGIFFPEFDEWARVNKAILKTTTRAKIGKDGIEEQITIDIDFNDGAWRPSSTIIANAELPKKGDTHPTISGCTLDTLSITNFNNQPDHFRCTLNYKYPQVQIDGGGGGGSGGNGEVTPLDEPFLINFTPQISNQLLAKDLDNKPIQNVNGEPYEWFTTKVRLDGVCTWNQFNWDQEDSEKWTNVINKDTWEVGDYKFASETVLLNYVVGNLRFYTDSDGQRVKYYEMTAGISVNNEKWSTEGKIDIRSQGSFYYADLASTTKLPRDYSAGRIKYDLDAFGGLASQDINEPTTTPTFDTFRVYELKKFSFVDI